MIKTTLQIIGLAFVITVIAGCNSYVAKSSSNLSRQESLNPDFNSIQTKIIQPYCVTCHGAGATLSFDSYAKVKGLAASIYSAVVVSQSMPPGQPLSADLRQLLANWVNRGAPETRAQLLAPAEIAELDDNVTFAGIVKDVLQPNCAACHGPGSSLPVTDYDFLVKMNWVVAGQPQNSNLYRAIVAGRMPPGNPLKTSAISEIETWIKNGAKK